jgi:cyanophycin synthetase
MNIIEIRDLDGPNLFLPEPAIKLEIEIPEDASLDARDVDTGNGLPSALSRLENLVRDLHAASGAEIPTTKLRAMEQQGHFVVAFAWSHRRFAKMLGKHAYQLLSGERTNLEECAVELRAILHSPAEDDDVPEMIPTAIRTIPVIAITGTNGKTTTTRVVSFVLKQTGRKVGATSSAGVYIDGSQVIAGDYSGPAGAHRVFEEPGVDVAVLETARGGMLLRGLAFESCDIGVITNVTADHLGLHGIYSLDKLTEVKSLIAKYTRADGFVVLNADDPRVMGMREVTKARPILVSRKPISDDVQRHIAAGGWALTVSDDLDVIWWHDGEQDVLMSLRDIPMTFSGRAPHMVENALCAAGALLGLGLSAGEVRDGLRQFRNSSNDNRGRLNVYELNGATIVLDFAHNVAGLEQLIAFGKNFVANGGRLTAVIGTAGDREDSVFRELAHVAASQADAIVLKDSHKYLRGREMGDMPALMREGVAESGRDIPVRVANSEREASLMAFGEASDGDVVVLMCIEDYDYLIPWLDEHGRSIS